MQVEENIYSYHMKPEFNIFSLLIQNNSTFLTTSPRRRLSLKHLPVSRHGFRIKSVCFFLQILLEKKDDIRRAKIFCRILAIQSSDIVVNTFVIFLSLFTPDLLLQLGCHASTWKRVAIVYWDNIHVYHRYGILLHLLNLVNASRL